jgi:hypothetical protein
MYAARGKLFAFAHAWQFPFVFTSVGQVSAFQLISW